MVAITILLIGVLGPLALATRGISDGLYIGNELAANYLAQEAMEISSGIRGLNAVSGLPWDNTLSSLGCNTPATQANQLINQSLDSGACSLDLNNLTVVSCNSSTPCQFVYDQSRKQYWYAGQVAAADQLGPIFTRRIYLVPTAVGDPNASLKVVVGLAWYNKTDLRSLVVTNYLYPRWKKASLFYMPFFWLVLF